jgi:hypothetical protein
VSVDAVSIPEPPPASAGHPVPSPKSVDEQEFREPATIYCEPSIDPEIYEILKNRPLPLRPKADDGPSYKGWQKEPKDEAYRAREEVLGALGDRLELWLSGYE